MLFVAAMYIYKGQSLETVLILQILRLVICIMGTGKLAVFIIEQQFSLSLKTVTRNKASRCLRLE